MTTVKETRRFPIAGVIVKPDDIRDLASILTQASEQLVTKESLRLTSFRIVADDGSEYDAATSEVFAKGGILEAKQLKSIEMIYRDYVAGPEISVRVEHGNSGGISNEVAVKGNDSTWVNGVTRKFEDAVSGFEKQSTWPKRFGPLLYILTALGIGRVVVVALALAATYIWRVQLTGGEPWPILLLWEVGIGVAPGSWLTGKLLELWPSVELRMGKEWGQVTRLRKARLWLVVSVAVIPLLLSRLYDVLKTWAHR